MTGTGLARAQVGTSGKTYAPRAGSRTVMLPRRRDPVIINGRFYGQALTGVQRYGRGIVGAMDPLFAAKGVEAELALPPGTDGPSLSAIKAVRVAPGQGHGWEQVALPLRGAGRMLNLCNTGPLFCQRQVLCIHDTNVFTQSDSYRPAFRLFYQGLQPLLARRAAALTTVSNASATAIAERFGVDRRRITVLPNGHEHALAWRPEASRFQADEDRRAFVLVLGSRARHKNTDLLLGLAPALDALGLDLVVAGGGAAIFADRPAGPGDLSHGGSRRSGNILWLGAVSDDDLAFLLPRALCLAFPSFTEGFGLPIVEAMALRCPVVSSDRASMPEVCGRAALMAAPDDPVTWLRHIEDLQASHSLREELRGRGVAQARRFSWSASAQGYFDLLERMA